MPLTTSGSLPEDLSDWTDVDIAAYQLGRALGIFAESTFGERKGVFWTDNRLGNGLHDALVALTAANVLEYRDEPDMQYRWAWKGDEVEISRLWK